MQRTEHRAGPVWQGPDEVDKDPAFVPLSREQAEALRRRHPLLSPWRVVATQAAVGVAAGVAVGLVTQRTDWASSLLFGAAVVVLPGALMARGMTSRLSSVSPGASAVSFMLWEMVKIAVSIAMLALAPTVLPAVNWPALLLGLVLCMKVYWWALLWQPQAQKAMQRA